MQSYNATYLQRLFSCLIDIAFYFVIWNIVAVPLSVLFAGVNFYLGSAEKPFYNLDGYYFVSSLCFIIFEISFGILIPFFSRGRSLGKKILKLKIVTFNTEAPSLKVIILRYFASRIYFISFFFLSTLIGLVFSCTLFPRIQCTFGDEELLIIFIPLVCLGLLTLISMAVGNIFIPLINKDRRALHDLMTETYVIDEIRN